MRRNAGNLTASRKGRGRLGALALGVVAVMSLVWQQQATVASYIDTEYAGATFTADTLKAITPTAKAATSSVDVSWDTADDWAPATYSLSWSATGSGTKPAPVYTGTGLAATHAVGSGKPSAYALTFTRVAAGATHACGVAGGSVYCWGTSASGALGLGTTTQAKVPTQVTGGDLGSRLVTDVTAGSDFTCAVASGTAYCWGGRLQRPARQRGAVIVVDAASRHRSEWCHEHLRGHRARLRRRLGQGVLLGRRRQRPAR